MRIDKVQKNLARVIENYFGADAGYLDIDCFTLARRIMEAGWTKPVRCKDCRWFNEPGCAIYIVDDSDKPKEDDFCSFGERRADV